MAAAAAPVTPGVADTERSGGDTTIFDTSRNAFSLPAANLSQDRQSAFFIGNSFFKSNWVEAPASGKGRDGLGPQFLARSCGGCHLLDGRAAPPPTKGNVSTANPVGLLLRLSIPGDGGRAGALADPVYGTQFATQAIAGVRPAGDIRIRYEVLRGRFGDGERYTLLKPRYTLHNLTGGPAHPQLLVSPRIAPQLVGMGLLEAIPAATLEATADRQAREGRGISGRLNRVWDVLRQEWLPGRFGWKANVGSVAQQTAAAFAGDIGITSAAFPEEECVATAPDCAAAKARENMVRQARGDALTDIDARALDRVVFYTMTLAVPARRGAGNARVRRGEALFADAGCANCHVPRAVTGELPGFPELSHQTIHPYTDLLLHDMGEGLADGRPDFAADGREWRTPPLWGIGLVDTVNGHTRFLHDGRARNLTEAILWHDGEAAASAARFRAMPRAERRALLAFLESL